MSQHDFDIANQGFAAFRTDLNNALQSLASLSSGTAAPATTYANQLWYETDTDTLWLRNEANSAWLSVMVINQSTGALTLSFADGTAALPSIAHAGDLNAGLFFPAADTVAMSTAGTERLRVDSSGNVGIGVTANAAIKLDVNGPVASRAALTADQTSAGVMAYTGTTTQLISYGSAVTGGIMDFYTGLGAVSPTLRMRINSSGNVGINTSTPSKTLEVYAASASLQISSIVKNDTAGAGVAAIGFNVSSSASGEATSTKAGIGLQRNFAFGGGFLCFYNNNSGASGDFTTADERMRIDGSGNVSIATSSSPNTLITTTTEVGAGIAQLGYGVFVRSSGEPLYVNRLTDDGVLVNLRQAGVSEGTISVSGTTVSYNGGHLSRWAQFPDNSRPELLKGTVMSNLDQMSNWDNEENEQLNCVQISTVEGDANVAGLFVAWDSTEDDYNDILLAMTGDMVIRIAAGVTVARGDLLMSAGDGTAKPQADDIIRAKTIAKVTSNHMSHTYADGSYAVPCVVMAC